MNRFNKINKILKSKERIRKLINHDFDTYMKKVGVIGLGNMGIGISKNLIKKGFETMGYDLKQERMKLLFQLGGKPAMNCREVGENADVVFIMVMNGQQVRDVILGQNGLLKGLKKGSTIIITATIKPSEIQAIEQPSIECGINLIDSPVSGGKFGAENGTLTMMVAAKKDIFEDCKNILEAVGKNIHYIGEKIGLGQKTKAALQALIGSSFTAIFESLVLGTKAGVDPEVLYEVFSTSGVSSNLFRECARFILDRKFENTGSHISTMYKDLGISMDMAKENGVVMFTTAAAFELFRAGMSLFPEGDNWSIVKLLEQIADIEIKGHRGIV
ncbi:MAG: NAD(P)-dependent oxidoreductase [Promethearchaeota archaeon]